MALTVAAARLRLESMLQWQAIPALLVSEVDTLLAMARRGDAFGSPPDDYLDWAASTVYVLAAQRVPTTRNGFFYEVTVAGTSGATEPEWPTTLSQTVADGTATWRCEGLAPWQPTWNLRSSAAEGWEWKAGKLIDKFDVKAGSVTASRNQQYEACMKKARQYRGGLLSSVETAVTLPYLGV